MTRAWPASFAAAAAALAFGRAQEPLTVPRVVAEVLADTDGDGRKELLVVAGEPADGVRFLRHAAAAGGAWEPRGAMRLRDPVHTLFAIADVHPRPGEEVVVADPSGTAWLEWPAAAGGDDPVVHALARRARFTLRTGAPQRSPFVRDLGRDGRLDLLLPTLRGVQPFVQEAPGDGDAPVFRAMDVVPVPIVTTVDGGTDGLDRELQGTLVIPQIETQDLDGDGRPDLLTRDELKHAFHLQRADGTFAPPVEVDLTQFQDSTPKAAVAPGSTLVLGDTQLLQRGDVDGDKIPDFVIAHRRKVWTFLSGKAGPQFTKARTQAVADDVTAMLIVDLDGDERAELLTFQVQVPGIGALLLGLVQSIDIDVKAVGYRSEGGAFANTPTWRRVVTLRIPPLLSLLSRQEELLQRFTDIVGKARLGVRGAFTAAARSDLALVRRDGNAVDLFVLDGEQPSLSRDAGRRLLRRVLFDDPDPVFDLDRLFGLLSGFLDELSGGLVGDRAPVATLALRDPASFRLVDLLVGDLDGTADPANGGARDEMVAVYERTAESASPPTRTYDVLVWPAAAAK